MKLQQWKVKFEDDDYNVYKGGNVLTSLDCSPETAQIKAWNKYMRNGQGVKCTVTKYKIREV